MVGLDSIKSGVTNILGQTTELVQSNPLASVGIAAGAAGVGGAVVGAAIARKKRRKKSSKKKKRKNGNKKRKRRSTRRGKRKRRYRYARTAGKRKDTSTRRIRQTKHGQPYIILASGKARFISKRSARMSRRRKGGRY